MVVSSKARASLEQLPASEELDSLSEEAILLEDFTELELPTLLLADVPEPELSDLLLEDSAELDVCTWEESWEESTDVASSLLEEALPSLESTFLPLEDFALLPDDSSELEDVFAFLLELLATLSDSMTML